MIFNVLGPFFSICSAMSGHVCQTHAFYCDISHGIFSFILDLQSLIHWFQVPLDQGLLRKFSVEETKNRKLWTVRQRVTKRPSRSQERMSSQNSHCLHSFCSSIWLLGLLHLYSWCSRTNQQRLLYFSAGALHSFCINYNYNSCTLFFVVSLYIL